MRTAYFLFTNKSQGWLSIFERSIYKHVSVVVIQDNCAFTCSYDQSAPNFGRVTIPKGFNIETRWGLFADIVCVIRCDVDNNQQSLYRSMPLMTCANLSAMVAGTNIGQVYKPSTLRKKLLRKSGQTNYNVSKMWLHKDICNLPSAQKLVRVI